ncbi:MAG: hypothetical protein GX677_05615 [Treponema sp.]|jgi:germination protein M|nr:hypothetical protein [Treponema sp.]
MSTKKRNSGLALACCILVALIIFIIFLVKKDTIITNLKDTAFFDRVFGKTPEFVENHQSAKTTEQIDLKNDSIIIDIQPEETKTTITEQNKINDSTPSITKNTEEVESTKTKEKNQTKPDVPTTNIKLYFINIDSDGSVIRKQITRSVAKNDSPLTTALKLLLEGPNSTSSSEKNCITLIPKNTKLLSARVQDRTAYLNFNENFEFNEVGIEGYIGQLMQIVYTSTEFSTVDSVQFLIDGNKKDYLGSEGQWIGSPLSRASFN